MKPLGNWTGIPRQMGMREADIHSVDFRDVRNGLNIPVTLAAMATKFLRVQTIRMERVIVLQLLACLSPTLTKLRIYCPLSPINPRWSNYAGKLPAGLKDVRIVQGERKFIL